MDDKKHTERLPPATFLYVAVSCGEGQCRDGKDYSSSCVQRSYNSSNFASFWAFSSASSWHLTELE